MKALTVILSFLGLFLISCEETNNVDSESLVKKDADNKATKEVTMEEALSKRWMYKERVSTDGTKKFTYGNESSDVVLRLDNNGYFIIYDSITDPNLIEKGVRKIEQRSSGQWELLSDDLLVLRKISNDTVIVDSLNIDSIEEGKLITKTINKNKITYFSID